MSNNTGNIYITGNTDDNKSTIALDNSIQWTKYDDSGKLLLGQVFSYTPPTSTDESKAVPIRLSTETSANFGQFAPGAEVPMHTTPTLDYAVMIEGILEMQMEMGETKTLYPGDVVVQRGTAHGWRNPSEDKWAKILFVFVYGEKEEKTTV